MDQFPSLFGPDEPERDTLLSQIEGTGMVDFRSRLNPAQYEAVSSIDGPVLVVAGAGSGKTRTLVHRVAYLVQQGIPPESILLMTFTRKAAAQMLQRAQDLVGERCGRVAGGTFHSLAHELLRRYAEHIGFPTNFGIMDRADMEEVIGHIRKAEGMGEKDKSFPKRSTIAGIISKAMNKSLDIPELMIDEYVHLKKYVGHITRLAEQYAAFKKENALLDFDDLLIHLASLLTGNESVRERIASTYRYIMVDEYQDTNPLQAEIIFQLGRDHRNVMVVGDDAQSIYSFRGASFRNIMEFPEKFQGCRIIKLEENYRSRQPILNLTNHIIAQAQDKYEKRLFTRREGKKLPRVLTPGSEKEQSLFICNKVRELIAQGISPSRIAILFRASSHSFDLELELMRNEIDFVKFGGRRFLDAAHIKDLLALLRLAANPTDTVSLTRVLMMVEGVGPSTAAKITAWVEGRRERLTALQEFSNKPKLRSSLTPLSDLFGSIADKGVGLQARIDQAWAYYRPIMEAKFDDHPSRLLDIKEFLRLAAGYRSLTRFLADMALEPPNTSLSTGAGTMGDRLVLSTIHSAKGLEWNVVFIIWAVDGRFPSMPALTNPGELEEERRLMYVAATRAEDDLYILSPMEQATYFPSPSMAKGSRFLRDLPNGLVATRDTEGADEPVEIQIHAPEKEETPVRPPVFSRRKPAGKVPSGSAGSTTNGFRVGRRVTHPVFGLGRVVEMLASGNIRVDFDHYGTKILKLAYANLKMADSL